MLKVGTILGNRYEIIEKIGAGGMSIVYRARDTTLERSVTVKVLRDEFITDEDFVSRFRIEARAAASLSHPNIVNVYDVGTEYDTYYIVMEYIPGCTLKEIIIKEAPFDNKKALNYSLKIAAALQHAHKNHIVHRDIKPQNILVTPEGELKVTDFGIAHAATSSTVTMTSTAIGSVHYLSPEQARGRYVDEKSDLYSLGIVMYEMLTSKLPFEGDSSVSIALKHINEDLPSIPSINPNISKSLDGIIVKATQKRVDQRYPDIDTMILDMKKALNDPSGNFIEKKDLAFSTTQKLSDKDLKTIREGSKIEELEDIEEFEESEIDIDDDYSKDLKKSEETKVIVSAIATAFAIIAIIFTVAYLVVNKKPNVPNNNIVAETTIKVPDLYNKTLEEAASILTTNELRIVQGQLVESDIIEDGKIVSQNPAKDTEVKKDTPITVDISTGSKKYIVPDLKNMSSIEAGNIIEKDKKFNLVMGEPEFNETVDFGLVLRQEPNANEKAKLGTEIKIILSKGISLKLVKVPNIAGLTEAKAVKKLEDNGLIAGSISYAESNSTEKGLVIKQLTAAGKELNTNDRVSFVVSKGKPEPTATKESTKSTTTTSSKETTTSSKETTTANKETTTANKETTTANKETTTANKETTTANKETTTSGEAKVVKNKTITIAKPSVEDGIETVTVKIIDLDTLEQLYVKEKNLSEFPFDATISGTGKTAIQLYMNYNGANYLQYETAINFDE